VDSVISRLVEASPIAASMIVICWMFLKSMEKREVIFQQALDKRDSRIERITDSLEEILDNNSAKLIELAQVINGCRKRD